MCDCQKILGVLVVILVLQLAYSQPKTWNGPIDIDSISCTCTQINSRNDKTSRTLGVLFEYEHFHDLTKLRVLGSAESYNSIQVLDTASHLENTIKYSSANLLTHEKFWITDRDSSLAICLNPCLQSKSEIPISVRLQHDIKQAHQWRNFDVDNFDSTVAEYTEIVRSLYDYDDIELLERYVTHNNTRIEFDMSPLTADEIESNKQQAKELLDELYADSIDVEDYIYENFISYGPSDEPISWSQFRALQIIYGPRKKDYLGRDQLDELSKEHLNAFIHPHYLTRVYADVIELDLNPDLLCLKPTSDDSILLGNKRKKIPMLLQVNGIVFDNEKGWNQANVHCVHPPMSVGLSGLSIKIDSLDIFFEGKRPMPYRIKSDSPWDHVGPRGSNIFAWADMWFESTEGDKVDATSDVIEYSSEAIKLGTGRVHFNNNEIYGMVWLHNFRKAGDPYGDLKGSFELDGKVQHFDKLVFKSAIESQGGQVRMEMVGDALSLRWWLPAKR